MSVGRLEASSGAVGAADEAPAVIPGHVVDVIIPARDEEGAVGAVVAAVPRPPIRSVVVVDNGSSDRTAVVARAAGAVVVPEPRRGYGAACMAGLRALPADTTIVVFLDGDGSDDARQVGEILRPIVEDRADLVIGARASAIAESGALTIPQRLGNALAVRWLRYRFGLPATDLGPFRAVRRSSLESLAMRDPDFGWTIEMQIKAARAGLRYAEVPVPCACRRAGRSKVSGTFRGAMGAALKILAWLAWYDFLGAVEAVWKLRHRTGSTHDRSLALGLRATPPAQRGSTSPDQRTSPPEHQIP